MKENMALLNAIDRLANVLKNGQLLASMSGGDLLLIAAADEIERLRTELESAYKLIERFRSEHEVLKSKTIKCFHCCDQFPAVEALRIGDKVFCSEQCMEPYKKIIHYK